MDDVFSQFIRLSYADDKGWVVCISCGVKKLWKEMQNGHYVERGNMMLRYDLRNCHPQCMQCNVYKKGNYPAYALAMVRKYGNQILEELEIESRKINQIKSYQYVEMISDYENRVKNILVDRLV